MNDNSETSRIGNEDTGTKGVTVIAPKPSFWINIISKFSKIIELRSHWYEDGFWII